MVRLKIIEIYCVQCQNYKRLIAIIIPELVEPHWYEYVLHNMRAAGLIRANPVCFYKN